MTHYVGNENNLDAIIGEGNKRYFYALRRTDDGTLYFAKVDQIKDNDEVIVVNEPGLSQNDFTDFEYGVDFFDGRLPDDHSRPYPNLKWDQIRWDNKNMYYYIDDNGNLVVRINKNYTYPEGSQV